MADDENPSITAFSGFPMCIPRGDNDPLCPLQNRPDRLPNFNRANGVVFNAPLPRVMAPFLVGDYIEYSGIQSDGDTIVWAITTINVQIRTVAGQNVPNFIRIEDALIGVWDPAANLEVADQRVRNFLNTRICLFR